MTRDEYFQKIRDLCPTCNAGVPVRYRPETREWVHDRVAKHGSATQFHHSLCQANDFRKANPEIANPDG